jgi:hypothetical protein
MPHDTRTGHAPEPAEAPRPRLRAAGQAATQDMAAARQGAETARTLILAQMVAGVPPDRIAGHQADTAAYLFSEAATDDARTFALAYGHEADTLIREQREESGRPGETWHLPDGTPHPDRVLAAKGWQTEGGIWVRRQPASLLATARQDDVTQLQNPGITCHRHTGGNTDRTRS